ncbi:MAG: pyridoxal phosphate-dependent aminotransferase [Myxococcota bacterium]
MASTTLDGTTVPSPPAWYRNLPPNIIAPLIARAQAQPSLAPLHLGDTYAPPPVEVQQAVAAAAGDPQTYRYQNIAGHDDLRDAVLARRRMNAVESDPALEQVFITHGATQAIFCAAHLLCEPGDEVLVLSPYYPLIPQAFAAASAVPIEVPFYGRRPAEALENLRSFLTPRTKVIALTNPNNPDGTVLPRDVVAQIVAFAREHGLWILSDESYEEIRFSDAPAHVPTATLPGAAAHTFTVSSFSKSYGLCGLRVGYAIVPPTLCQAARDALMLSGIHPSNLAQRAALAALGVADAHGRSQRARYEVSRDVAVSALQDVCDFVVPDGATYLFVDLSRHLGGRTPTALLEDIVTHADVLLSPGALFGAAYERHARLCFSAVPTEVLSQACERLRSYLGERSRRAG